MNPVEPDHRLVARAVAGDASAFTDLMRRHQDRVYTLARGIVRHADDAADVTQETFMAALRSLDQFRADAQFTTWLHRIAVRKAYDALRRRVPEPHAPDAAPLASLHSSSGDVHETHLDAVALRDAIAALDVPFREAIVLVDVLGTSVVEAAAILGVAPGTVKSRCFRGRATLATLLGTSGVHRTSDEVDDHA